MRRRALWLCGLLWGCPETATEAPVAPRPAPDLAVIDAGAGDMQITDLGAVDAAPRADMTPIDMALDQAVDMAPPRDMQVVDMRPIDMQPVDMILDLAVDMAPDMPPVDMAVIDFGPLPEQACFDEIDNDDDGRTDCADPDCRFTPACFDAPEDCENGVDDNGDLWADCDDVLCLDVCPPVDRAPIEVPEIQARFDIECVQCHSGPQPDAALDLTDFVETTVGVRSSQVDGLRIAPGDRQASYLWRKMAYTFRTFEGGGGDAMPLAGPLDADFVDRFGDWIDRQ